MGDITQNCGCVMHDGGKSWTLCDFHEEMAEPEEWADVMDHLAQKAHSAPGTFLDRLEATGQPPHLLDHLTAEAQEMGLYEDGEPLRLGARGSIAIGEAAEIEWPRTPFPVLPHLTLLVRRGSEAHGLYVPPGDAHGTDDKDRFGIVVPPMRYYLGTANWEHAEEINGPWDVVLYTFAKAVKLLCKQNPNMLSHLWVDPSDYLYLGPAGQTLVEHRDLFRSRTTAFRSFVGYARAQVEKASKHRDGKRGYMGEKRYRLVQKHGYDCKNASHAVRLLHTGKEFLETGRVNVRRTWDKQMLLDIKRGEWSLERVKAYVAGAQEACDEAYENSSLPEEVDMDAVDRLCVDALQAEFSAREGR